MISYIVLFVLVSLILFTSCTNAIELQAKTYTIEFNTNNGSLIDEIKIEENTNISIPTEPTRAGYIFDGWYLDNASFIQSAEATLNAPITSDITIYARWIEGEPIMTNNPKIVITLDDGRQIKLELYPEIAPISVANFLNLVDSGYYTNTVFHRIIRNFMIQAGSLEYNDDKLGYKAQVPTIKGEFASNNVPNNLAHTLGVISMARASNNDSASSQFFICSATYPSLDGQYAAFGKTLDNASNQVILELSYSNTTTYSGMSNFPFNDDNSFVIIASILRLETE